MRIIFIAILIMSFGWAKAQEKLKNFPVNSSGIVEYTETVACDGMTQAQLMERAKKWAFVTYTNYKEVITFESSDAIGGKGAFSFISSNAMASTEIFVTYKLMVEVLDGKYSITINNYIFQMTSPLAVEPIKKAIDGRLDKGKEAAPAQQVMIDELDKNSRALMETLKKTMTAK